MITVRDRFYFSIAAKLALSCQHKFKVAALIAAGSRIISLSTNIIRTHPRTQLSFPNRVTTVHAEQRAVALARRAPRDTIYVARQASYGLGRSKPCIMCQELIVLSGITRVVYYAEGVQEWDIFMEH